MARDFTYSLAVEKGKAEGLGLGRNEIGVGIRGIGTQAVVEVGDVEGET